MPPAGAGWIRDLPDFRDWTLQTPAVRDALARLKRRRAPRGAGLPASVDLREFVAPPRDLGTLRAASASAVLGLAQWYERRAHGRAFDGSITFLHRTALRLAGTTGDNGVGLRTALKALARFGCPPEHYWPDTAASFDREPDAFAHGFQREFADLQFVRLDPPAAPPAEVLKAIKTLLVAGFACVGGFAMPGTLGAGPDIAFPVRNDAVVGGAAVVVVGYDDAYRIRSTKGALLVCAPFSPSWGDGGFGRLPYRYVETGLACDFWMLTKPDWLASGEFEQPDWKAR